MSLISGSVQNSNVSDSGLKRGRCAKKEFNISVFITQFEFLGRSSFICINL